MSKMQDILDKVESHRKDGNIDGALDEIVEAIKLLSRGNQQIMGDISRLESSRTDIPIG